MSCLFDPTPVMLMLPLRPTLLVPGSPWGLGCCRAYSRLGTAYQTPREESSCEPQGGGTLCAEQGSTNEWRDAQAVQFHHWHHDVR